MGRQIMVRRITGLLPALTALLFLLRLTPPVGSVGVPSAVPQQVGPATPLVGSQSCPLGIAVDNAGDLIWSNFCSGQLLSLARNASLPRVMLTGLNGPIGVAVDGAGNIYYDEYYGGTLSELPLGSGTPRLLASGLDHPSFLSASQAGDVYLVTGQVCGNQILEFNASSHVTQKLLEAPHGFAGIFVDQSGDLYFTTCGHTMINMLPAGATASKALVNATGGSVTESPSTVYGIAVDHSGDVFYTYDGNVNELPFNSTTPVLLTNSGSTENQVAIDPAGNLYYTDYVGGRIWTVPTQISITVTATITNVLTTSVATQVVSATTTTLVLTSVATSVSTEVLTSASISVSMTTQTSLGTETSSFNEVTTQTLTQPIPYTITSATTVTTAPAPGSPSAFPSTSLETMIGVLAAAIIITGLIIRTRRRKDQAPTGAVTATARPASPSGLEMVDRIVFKYVEDRHGEISIAKAAAELGLSEAELREALKRLVSKGLLAGDEKK